MSDTYETLVRVFPPRVICTEQEYKRASRIELSRRVREDLMLDTVDASDFPSPRPADYDLPSNELGSILSRSPVMPNPEVERCLRVYRIGHPASLPIESGPRPVVERRLRVYTLSDFLLREILRGVRELEASRGAAPDDLRLVSVHFDYQRGVNLKVYIASGTFEHVPEGTHPPSGGRVPPELMRPSRDPEGPAAPAASPAPHGRYLDLVREFPLRPIRTHEDYEKAKARYDEVVGLIDLCRCDACRADPAKREWWDYLEVLGDQIARHVQKAPVSKVARYEAQESRQKGPTHTPDPSEFKRHTWPGWGRPAKDADATNAHYLELTREFLPCPIRSEEEYWEASRRLDRVMCLLDNSRIASETLAREAYRANLVRQMIRYKKNMIERARRVREDLAVETEDKPDPVEDFPILREMLDPKPDLWDDRDADADADADATVAGDPPDEPGPAGETPASSWRDRPPML